jgi:hypothetical protein
MSPVTPSNSGDKKHITTGNRKRKKRSGISRFREKRRRTPSEQENATMNLAMPSTPDRAQSSPDSARSSPKLPFFFHVEKSSTPMKLLFERTAQGYKISPKLLFQKETSPTKRPVPSEETLDEPSPAVDKPLPAATMKPLLYNGQLVDFSKVDTFDINFDAFSHKWKHGEKIDRTRSDAVRQAESRATRKIVTAIKESGGDNSQRALALYRALCNEDIRPVSKACGFQSEKMPALLYHFEQIADMLQTASNERGRTNLDQALLTDTMLSALVADDDGEKTKKTPTMKETMDLLGLKYSNAGKNKIKRAIQTRKKIKAAKSSTRNAKWILLIKRQWKGSRKVTKEVRAKVIEWIKNHDHVVNSPIYNETILVTDPETSEKCRVSKLLIEIPIRELHCNLVEACEKGGLLESRDDKGRIIVSDTTLRKIIKEDLPQLRRMSSRHKLMCGCEICVGVGTIQRSLNAFRRRECKKISAAAEVTVENQYYLDRVLPGGNDWHEKPRQALQEMQCPDLHCGFPHWNCVVRDCSECPKYKVPKNETGEDENAPIIRFHHYRKATKCSKHGDLELNAKSCPSCDMIEKITAKGKIRTRKYLTLLTRPIGTFHKTFYIPMLEKYAYHYPHIRILSKTGCGAMRLDWFRRMLKCIKTIHDYAERLKVSMNNEIQSEHFGHSRSLSIEGCSCRYMDDSGKSVMEMHSHFSDLSRQDARTTFSHMNVEIKHYKERGILGDNGTVFDDTDGCSKQYRSGTALFLLTLLAVSHGVIIDRAVGAPGHGKDEVDGLNAVDKQFISKKMSQATMPEENDSTQKINPEAMVENASKSIAKEAARLCRNENRIHGVKSEGKYRKREESASMKQRFYWEDGEFEITSSFDNLTMVCKPWYKPKDRKNNGISSMYNFRADPKLGLGRIAIRRIPCACDSCRQLLMKEWVNNLPADKQPRYGRNTDCIFWDIFEGRNDWHIVQLVPDNGSSKEEFNQAQQLVVDSWVEKAAENIVEGRYGAINTDDPDADGYYVVKFLGKPFQVVETCFLEEYTPPQRVEQGEHLCDAVYLNKVPGARLWYTRSSDQTKVRVSQLLATNLSLEAESEANPLPNNCQKEEARRLGARKVTVESHLGLLDEISRREIIQIEEDDDDVLQNSDEDLPSGEEVSSDDESDESSDSEK